MFGFQNVVKPSLVDAENSFFEQCNRSGTPGFGLTFGQDGNFPFPYDPALDLYFAYRWDFYEDVNGTGYGMTPPLTEEEVKKIKALWLTSHPSFYAGHHLKTKARLTRVVMKKPQTLMVPNVHFLVDETWDGDPNHRGDFNLRQITQQYVNMGIEGFYTNTPQGSPDFLLINPSKYIVGANWYEFEEGTKIFKQVIDAIRKLY